MTPQEDFKEAMHDIYKYSLLIGLEDQELLQSWVKRLVQVGTGADSNPGKALDYARYLAYQLQRGQLRFPFSQRPSEAEGVEGALRDLQDLLFGADSVADAADLSTSCHGSGVRTGGGGQRALLSPMSPAPYSGPDTSWDSHRRTPDEASDWDWDSHSADPARGQRDVAARLEELPEGAPLWLLLTQVGPHTRDGGALLHAVVAEELAEWSARSAGTAAGHGEHTDGDDEEWGPRADRRADYWHEVIEAQKRLQNDDHKAAQQLTSDINAWLDQQDKQMQGELALLQALAEELRDIRRQVTQSQRWKEAQFDMQNRALLSEVAALKESISKNAKKAETLYQPRRDLQKSVSTSSATRRKLSTSIDSLNTSQDLNKTSN